MAKAEDTFSNLHVIKHLQVHDFHILGNLDVSLTQLHAQLSGEFQQNSNTLSTYLIIQPDYTELGTLEHLTDNRTILLQKHLSNPSMDSILFSDMHYDHFLNPTYSYRFTSDRDVVLLYSTVDNHVFCEPLYKLNTLNLKDRDLPFLFDDEPPELEIPYSNLF